MVAPPPLGNLRIVAPRSAAFAAIKSALSVLITIRPYVFFALGQWIVVEMCQYQHQRRLVRSNHTYFNYIITFSGILKNAF
jgi:hypothetical protein